MVKRNITYRDFEGEERTDVFYFNLTEAELADIELEYDGDMAKKLQNMQEKHDGRGVFAMISNLILRSYGEKTSDGKRFVKNAEIRESFAASDAYSKLLFDLLEDDNKLAGFMTAIMPVDIRAKVEERFAEEKKVKEAEVADNA